MDLEARLVRRYHQLVRSHMVTSDLLSSGVKSSLESNEAFSQTQAEASDELPLNSAH
jgi:hypothetical protein